MDIFGLSDEEYEDDVEDVVAEDDHDGDYDPDDKDYEASNYTRRAVRAARGRPARRNGARGAKHGSKETPARKDCDLAQYDDGAISESRAVEQARERRPALHDPPQHASVGAPGPSMIKPAGAVARDAASRRWGAGQKRPSLPSVAHVSKPKTLPAVAPSAASKRRALEGPSNRCIPAADDVSESDDDVADVAEHERSMKVMRRAFDKQPFH